MADQLADPKARIRYDASLACRTWMTYSPLRFFGRLDRPASWQVRTLDDLSAPPPMG
jgi:hypothetical protein